MRTNRAMTKGEGKIASVYIGKFLKPNIDSFFIEGSFDHLLLAYVKSLLMNFEGNFVQNGH